jgi:predicted methyltransferase
MRFNSFAAGVALGLLASVSTDSLVASENKNLAPIEQAVAGSWRPGEEKERDVYRHPDDALAFWGLKPGATILEIQPGGGWWTDILAPYARATKGAFYATAADLSDPALPENARKSREDFAARYGDPAIYGKVNLVNWGPKAAALPANKFDFVLLARGIHGWVRQGTFEKNLADVFQATKPGGVLAVEQHRAPKGQDPSVFNGYVDEAFVIAQAEKAGYKLDGKSEINANPKDTKDHPFGVWTLPPTRQSAENGKPADPSFDHARYDAIGESDRMTLRFVKPKK